MEDSCCKASNCYIGFYAQLFRLRLSCWWSICCHGSWTRRRRASRSWIATSSIMRLSSVLSRYGDGRRAFASRWSTSCASLIYWFRVADCRTLTDSPGIQPWSHEESTRDQNMETSAAQYLSKFVLDSRRNIYSWASIKLWHVKVCRRFQISSSQAKCTFQGTLIRM